ncbi:MAG TPA: hypothetical protein PLJ42_10780 [Chitinophagales bacterium]|jgi:hypothetical protein|nr:hypothetical protein [Chitinophagales bacterium]MBP6153411.1 hypothetical protein [Chitinophagales bacterium]HQV79138.1 hypothetical protein [Chitinophagales bacterium]HQW79906.1 hypothetical protein [Chitinophagales bacterium]HRB19372.1 hypothetical protein [Chitinophagales bacterium]
MNNYLITLLSFLFINLSFAQNTWQLEKNKEGIKIWNRKSDGSILKEFKVSMILNTTPETIVTFLKKTTQYDQWMYKVNKGSVKVIKRNNENDYYTYMTISAPFIKTREAITHMTFQPADNNGVILITLEGTPNLLPKNDNFVRINKMQAYFKIIPLSNGKVELVHQALSSPGGNIPDALVNMSSVDCPYSMFTKIRELL